MVKFKPFQSIINRQSLRFSCRCVSVATNIGIKGISALCGVEFTAALVKRVAEYRGIQRFADNRTFADINAIIAQLNVTAFGAGLLRGKAV